MEMESKRQAWKEAQTKAVRETEVGNDGDSDNERKYDEKK